MTAFFGLVFFISIPALLLGLIRPSIYSRLLKGKATRKKITLIFGGAMLVSFIGIAATVPPADDVQGIAEESDTEVQPDAQEAVGEEELEESSLVEDGEEVNLTQEDDQTAEPSSVANEPDEDALEDSGSSSEDSAAASDLEPTEDPSTGTETSGEPLAEPEEVTEPTQEATESEEPETQAAMPSEETTTASCYCSSNIYNCTEEHFSSHAEAQALYECCLMDVGYDVHDLDRDNNGLACESLP